MRRFVALAIAVIVVSGCAATNEEMKKLQNQNVQLQSSLDAANASISSLEQQKDALTGKVDTLTRISGTLEREKAVRVEETSQLRKNVRGFIRTQMSAFREFSKDEDFLDYIGGELIERFGDVGKSMSLIDTKNKMNDDGTLFGVRGQFDKPVKMYLAVLRAIKEKWVVVWRTEEIDVAKPGLQQIDFKVPVSVQAGDLVSYVFPGEIPVACDQGTGGIVALDEQLASGRKVAQMDVDSLKGWACSIGVVGMLGD